MSNRSRHMADFYIAGMRFWDGATVLSKLKPGKKLTLVAEPDNPVDADAVAIYRKGVKLGFVPSQFNEIPAQLLRFGHGDVLECRVLKVDPQADPWRQVYVGIYMTDHTVAEIAEPSPVEAFTS